MMRGTPLYVIFHETQEVIFLIENGVAYLGMQSFKETLGIPDYKGMVCKSKCQFKELQRQEASSNGNQSMGSEIQTE